MIGRRLRRVFHRFRRGSTVPPTPSSYDVPSPPPNSSLAKTYGRREQDFDPRFRKHNHITSSDTGVYHRVESRPVDVPRSPSGALDQNTCLYSSSDHAQSLDTGRPALRPRESTIMPRSTAAYVGGAPRSSLTSTIISSRNGGTSVPSDSVHFMNVAPQLGHPFRTPYPDTDRSGEVPTPGWFTGLFYDEGESVSSGSSYTSIFDSLEDHMADCHWGQQADSRADQRDNVESTLSGPPLTSWFSFNDDSMESLFDTELIVLAERDRRDAKFELVDHPHSNPVILELEGDVNGQTDNKMPETCSMDATLLGNAVTRQVTPLSGPTLPAHSTLALTGSIYTAASSSVEPTKQQIHSLVPEPPGLPPLPLSPPSFSSLGSRASDLVRDGLEAQLGDSNWDQVDSSYDWGPQLPPALDGMTHLDTLVARDPSSGTTSTLNLQPNMPVPKHHVNSLHPLDDARLPLGVELVQPDLGPYELDTASSNVTGHDHVATNRSDISCKHRGDLVNRPTASNYSSNIANAYDEGHEPVGDRAIPPTHASAEDIFKTEPHDQGEGQSHTSPLLVTTTTVTWLYVASDPENRVIRTDGCQKPDEYHEITALSTPRRGSNHGSIASHVLHSARNSALSSMDLKGVFKEPDIFHILHLTGMGANIGICTPPPNNIRYPNLLPRKQHFASLVIILWVLSMGTGPSWVMRLHMKRSHYVTTMPTLSSTPFPIRSRQRMLRTTQLVRAICTHAFGRDSGASGSALNIGHKSGSNQTPENTYPRLEDGSGIWSGQGPGPSLNVLSSQGPGSLGLASRFGGLFQARGDSIMGVLYDSSRDVATRSLHSAPDPPVPRDPEEIESISKAYSEAFYQGFRQGRSRGFADGFAEGYIEGSRNLRTDPLKPAPNGPGPQQLNASGVQEGLISIPRDSASGPSSGLSCTETSWCSDLLPVGVDASRHRESNLPGIRLPPDAPDWPTGDFIIVENLPDPADDALWGSCIQSLAPHANANADPSINLQDPGEPLVGNGRPPGGNPGSTTAAGRFVDPPHSILPASETHPARPATTPDTGPGLQPPRTQLDDRGNEERYSCNRCNKRFRRPYLLDDHISMVHEQMGRHICTVQGCKRRYASRAGLMRHLGKPHPQGANSQGAPPPGSRLAQGEIQEQTPEAESSNGGASRRNKRSLRELIPYAPSATRHRSRRRDQ